MSKVFKFRLYKEGFRQLKVIGIIFTIVMAFAAIATPLIRLLKIKSLAGDISVYTMGGIESHFTLILLPCVFAPIMTLFLFKFLNKRSTSDFYHALPYTRTTIYLSFMASIASWLLVATVFSTMLNILTGLIVSQYVAVVYSTVLMLALNCFTAALLVMASIGIAMSVTGNFFSNVVVSLMIIFLPRIAVLYYSSNMSEVLPMVIKAHQTSLISNEYNIVTNLVFGGFQSLFGESCTSFISSLYAVKPFLYTLILAVIYFVAGTFIFNKRKSESAEKAASNRILQTIFRITVTMLFCLFACSIVFKKCIGINSSDIWTAVIIYTIAVLAYFVYELISTKKIKISFKTAQGLIIVAVLNIALIFGMKIAYERQLSFVPEANEIISVSPIYEDSDFNELSIEDAVNLRGESIVIKDTELFKEVSDGIKSCTEFVRENPDSVSYYNKYVDNGSTKAKYNNYRFKVVTKGGTYYRNVPIAIEKVEKTNKILFSNQEYINMWKTPPEPIKGTITTRAGIPYASSSQLLTDKQNEKLFETYKEELKSADIQKYMSRLLSFQDDYSLSLICSTEINNSIYTVNITVFRELLPKTFDLYMQNVYDLSMSETKVKLNKLVAQNFANVSGDLSVAYHKYDSESNDYINYYFSAENINESADDSVKAVYYAFDNSQEGICNDTDSYFEITGMFYDTLENGEYDYSKSEYFSLILKANSVDVNKLPKSYKSQSY